MKDGSVTDNPKKIKENVQRFYKNLFKEDKINLNHCKNFLDEYKNYNPIGTLTNEEKIKLVEPIKNNEVKEAIENSPINKAPSPDGISFDFFKTFKE